MAPKTCELFIATCEKIIFLQDSELNYREIGKKSNLNFSNVHYVIKKEKETGLILNNWVSKKRSHAK